MTLTLKSEMDTVYCHGECGYLVEASIEPYLFVL